MTTNPFVTYNTSFLYPGERIAPLNTYVNYHNGYVIAPYYFVTTFGRVFSYATGVFVEKSQYINPTGYREVTVMTPERSEKHLIIHRAVMATFCPVPNMDKLQVDHIDGDHFNNNINNLRWATSSQNNMYAHVTGIAPKRSRNITDNDIIDIMNHVNMGMSDEEISNMMVDVKVAPQTVRIIRTGQAIYGDILKRLGIEPVFQRSHNAHTSEDDKKVIELYKLGMNSIQISDKTGIPDRTVRTIIQKSSVTRSDYPATPRARNPIATVPEKYSDAGIVMVNTKTSPLHTLAPVYGVTRDGRMFSMARGNKWTEMVVRPNPVGYPVVGLVTTDHGTKQFFVHRIVLSTFNPVPNMYDLEVNHINGIHDDNRLENLEWVTKQENMRHAIDTIIERKPQRAPDDDIRKIIQLANDGKSDEQISEIMGHYTPHNVRIIRSGLKTYGPVLEQLGLKPYKYIHGAVSTENREAIYDFIESRLGSKGLMDLYVDAGKEFDVSPETIRGIYSQERAKRK